MRSAIYIYMLFAIAGSSLISACDTPPSPNSKVFLKYFGQDGSQSCVDLEVDAEGNFYMLGNNRETSTPDDPHTGLFMIKVDANGNLVWKQTILPPSPGNITENGLDAKDIELLSDGGLIVLADYYKSTDHDLFVGRYSRETGVERDNKVIEAVNLNYDPLAGIPEPIRDDRGSSITEITSGRKGFIIAGSSNNLSPAVGATQHARDGIHVRLDELLVQESKDTWKDVYGIGNENYEVKVIQEGDYFYSFGYGTKSINSTDIDFNILRLNGEDGAPITMLDPEKHLGSVDGMDRLGSVCFVGTTFFLSGVSTGPGIAPSSSLFVAKATLSGDGLSVNPIKLGAQADYPLKNPGGSFTSSAASTSGGFFVLTNEFLNGAGDGQIFLAKVGSDGAKLWGDNAPSFGGKDNDLAGAVRELPDGRIVVGGTISINGESKMALLKLNKNGQLAE